MTLEEQEVVHCSYPTYGVRHFVDDLGVWCAEDKKNEVVVNDIESETNILTSVSDPAHTVVEVPKPANPFGMISPYDLGETELKTALERTRMILQVPWKAADVGTIYTMSNVAQPMFDTGVNEDWNNPFARVSSGYNFFTGDLVLDIYTQGNRNCSGAVVVASKIDHNTTSVYWGNVTSLPYVIVRAQSDERIRMVLPRAYPYPMKRDILDKGWGSLTLYVQSSLASCQSAAPPDMLICVEAHWENVRFIGPSTTHYSFPVRFEQQSLVAEAAAMAKLGYQGLKKAPKILKSVGSVLDTIFDSGHSQPMDMQQPVRQVPFGPTAWNTTGPWMGTSLDTGTMAPTNPVDGVKDFSSFNDYLDHYTHVARGTVGTDFQPGNVVLHIPNDPSYGTTTDEPTRWTFPMDRMRYLSQRFTFWRGDIKYKILFYAPKGVKGTFLISHMSEVGIVQGEVANMGDKPGYSVVVDGDHEVDLVAKFQGLTPYKVCNDVLENGSTDQSAAGSIQIQLLSYVVSSFDVPASISIVVLRSTDNMEFYGPRTNTFTFQSKEEIVFASETPKMLTVNGTDRSENIPLFGPRWKVGSFAELFRIWNVKGGSNTLNLHHLPEEERLFAWMRGGWRFGNCVVHVKHSSFNRVLNRHIALHPDVARSTFSEVPYSANIAYTPLRLLEDNYYLDSIFESTYDLTESEGNTSIYFRGDGCQYFFPALLPTAIKNKPPPPLAQKPPQPKEQDPVDIEDLGLALTPEKSERKLKSTGNSVLVKKSE